MVMPAGGEGWTVGGCGSSLPDRGIPPLPTTPGERRGFRLGIAAGEGAMQRQGCPCFTPGTMIATDRGLRPVERLAPGDLVVTRDDGLAEIVWTGRRDLTRRELDGSRELSPVLVRRGAPDGLRPLVDMLVSPNHRRAKARSASLQPSTSSTAGASIAPRRSA